MGTSGFHSWKSWCPLSLTLVVPESEIYCRKPLGTLRRKPDRTVLLSKIRFCLFLSLAYASVMKNETRVAGAHPRRRIAGEEGIVLFSGVKIHEVEREDCLSKRRRSLRVKMAVTNTWKNLYFMKSHI